MESSETAAQREEGRRVVRAAAALVRRSWALLEESAAAEPGGTDRGTGAGVVQPPLRTDQLALLLRRTRTHLCEFPFRSGTVGMAIPWGADEHAILLDSSAPPADYAFTLRHELAHVLAGEVGEALFLSSADTFSFAERRADLFAVVDLAPAWLLRQLRGRRRPWAHVRLEVQQTFRELTDRWSEQRLRDRAALRVEVYREFGI